MPAEFPASAALPPPPAQAAIPAQENTADRLVAWLQSPWSWALLCLAAALPLAYPSMPPLTDLGGHLGRFAVQIDGGKSADLRQWYSFHWALIPNLGCDLLVQLLAPIMGLEPALKAIVIAIPVIQVAGFLLLARAVHGHVPSTTLFALPLAYSYPFQFGFINFALSAALATCVLALWIAMGSRDRIALRWAVFIPISCLLWLCHLVGWSLFCIFAAAAELQHAREHAPGLRQALQRCVLPLSCLLAPWLVKLLWPGAPSGHGVTEEFFKLDIKFDYLFMALRDRWAWWDIASTLMLASLIAWGWRSARCVRHRGLALGVTVLAIVYLIMPGTILGSHFADMRLAPTLLAMAIIAFRPALGACRRMVGGLAIAGMVFTGARLTANAASLARLDRQFNRDLALLDQVPRGATLISITTESCHQLVHPWQRERRFHLGGYAIARRHDFSNDQWIIPGGQLLSVHNPAAGEFAKDDSEMAQMPGCKGKKAVQERVKLVPRAMQYLWILGDGVATPIAGWRPVLRSWNSVMYSSDFRKTPNAPPT